MKYIAILCIVMTGCYFPALEAEQKRVQFNNRANAAFDRVEAECKIKKLSDEDCESERQKVREEISLMTAKVPQR